MMRVTCVTAVHGIMVKRRHWPTSRLRLSAARAERGEAKSRRIYDLQEKQYLQGRLSKVFTDKSVHSFPGPLEELDGPDRPQLRENPPDLVLVQLVAHAALQRKADTPALVT